jgi:hypothetical protein
LTRPPPLCEGFAHWIALKAMIESVAFGTTEYAEITAGSS